MFLGIGPLSCPGTTNWDWVSRYAASRKNAGESDTRRRDLNDTIAEIVIPRSEIYPCAEYKYRGISMLRGIAVLALGPHHTTIAGKAGGDGIGPFH